MRSDAIKKGVKRIPHRSLLKALGITDEELEKPLILVMNSYNETVPGHIHLDKISNAVKLGISSAGGVPLECNTIGICDGIAMNVNMEYSLISREIIADSVEIVANANMFDGIVCIASCDKIVPGMLMGCLLYTSPSPRDLSTSRMPSSA